MQAKDKCLSRWWLDMALVSGSVSKWEVPESPDLCGGVRALSGTAIWRDVRW